MTTASASSRIQVGDWTADRSTGRLTRAGEARPVEPKVMDLLFLLASEPNRVFLRDEIYGRLWPGVTVGDDSLARCVSKLRKALSDQAGAPRFVETVSKRGYRLIAAISEPGPGLGHGSPSPGARRTIMALAATAVALLLLLVITISRSGIADPRPDTSVDRADSTRTEAERLRRLSDIDRAEAEARKRAGR